MNTQESTARVYESSPILLMSRLVELASPALNVAAPLARAVVTRRTRLAPPPRRGKAAPLHSQRAEASAYNEG